MWYVSDFYVGVCWLCMKGFGLVQDDFGQGLSLVYNLVNIFFIEVKIDCVLVSGCVCDLVLYLILLMVIVLVNQLGLIIVVEGVESDVDFVVLWQLGCSQVQGFLILQVLLLDEFNCLLDEEVL